MAAKSVTFTSSTSGIYLMTTLFPRLGIADEMEMKSTTIGVVSVVRGQAELAIQPASELIPVQGVDFVGTIPAELQKVNTYAAAMVAGSKQADGARRLIAFLSSPSAFAAIRRSGMEPSHEPSADLRVILSGAFMAAPAVAGGEAGSDFGRSANCSRRRVLTTSDHCPPMSNASRSSQQASWLAPKNRKRRVLS